MFNPNPAATGNCTIVFDIDEQKYLFVSESFYNLFEVGADHLHQNVDFLIGLVKPETFAGVKQLTEGLAMNESIQITYPLEAGQKQLTEKRTLTTDGLTGHKIILSNITSALDGVRTPIPFIKPGLSEQFLNSLIDSQTNFLVRVDTNGRFSFANRRFLKPSVMMRLT